jgi:hypothetical protein
MSQTDVSAGEHENIVASLRDAYNHLTKIKVMILNKLYIRRYTYLPRKNDPKLILRINLMKLSENEHNVVGKII